HVAGGAHLVFEIVPRQGSRIYALRRPQGLHEGPKNALYFVHGRPRFGETVMDAATRLVKEQAGCKVKSTSLLSMDSWVDGIEHWHLCLNIVADVIGKPKPAKDVPEIVAITKGHVPGEAPEAGGFAWWTPADVASLFKGMK
ncbi:MAG: NUDIX hydrolase, partial [bacterium]